MNDLSLISEIEAAELRGQYRQLDLREEELKRELARIREHKSAIGGKMLLGKHAQFDAALLQDANTTIVIENGTSH